MKKICKKIKESKKLRYIVILIVILILNALVAGLITNSRYTSKINFEAIQDIGYTIFKMSLYNPQSVAGYDSTKNEVTISPGQTKTFQCKITNVDNSYYNEMDLKCYLKILDETRKSSK